MEDICYIMCPGTSLNHHSSEFNTSMKKVSDTELHIYALKDIHKGGLISESIFPFGHIIKKKSLILTCHFRLRS